MATQTLIRPDGTALSYVKDTPEKPAYPVGVMFMHGFKSDKAATKVTFVRDLCARENIPFLAFDFFAHGESTGNWDEFTIGRAFYDALLAIDLLTEGPQIIIGSSMGGWVALKLMEERAERIAGLIGIAAAPDFTRWIEENHTKEQRLEAGFTDLLLSEAKNQYVMDENWDFEGPVTLLQGKMDEEVPWETAESIKNKLKNPNYAEIIYVDDGNHTLKRPEDLALLEKTLLSMINKHS
ncbi:MAG: alpha/beta hydrolase [Proteobacteria bacterium]|nr:alpha/beta hydrolase [Pseudomonadota bacterium]